MIMQREAVNVIAEVCIVVLAKVGIIETCPFGKDMIDLTLIDLARKGEAVDECTVSQTARVRQEISNRDLVGYVILKMNTRSIFCERIRKFDLVFLIQHRGRQRCK